MHRHRLTLSASHDVDQHFDPHLRHEVDRVLGAPIHLDVAALAPEALHLAHGEPLHAEHFEAAFTSSSLNGLMTAVMSFMHPPSLYFPPAPGT